MRKLLTSASIAASYLIPFSYAFAETKVKVCPDSGPFKNLCSLDLAGSVGDLIVLAFILAVLIALTFLIYGGIRWIAAGGDKTQIESARETIVGAIIGLVIVFLAYFILNILLQFFIGKPINEGFDLPKIGA